jgi:hypothetical protein
MFRILSVIIPLLFFSLKLHSQLFIIEHTNIVDVKNNKLIRDVSVVVENSRIKDIQKNTSGYKGQVIDGKNKYLMPGLWDMHTHTWNARYFFPLLIANGVTGIRDMFGSMDSINRWKKEIAEGKILGPQIYASGPLLDGPKPIWPGSVALSHENQVASIIDSLKNKLKVDFLKVYSLLPRSVYFKIAEESKKQNISFVGHLPNQITILEAAHAGQKSQEHLLSFIAESADSAEYIAKASKNLLTDSSLKNPLARAQLQFATFNPSKLSVIIDKLAKSETWICPTLVVNNSIGRMRDTIFTNDPRIQYMMPGMANRWNPANDFRFKSVPDTYYHLQQKMFDLQLKIVKEIHEKGIPLLAGTDYPNPYCFPGFSLHDELLWMVKAGLTPGEALQTATLNPARFLAITKDYGTVEKGKIANLVLLEKNPLENIEHTKTIHMVILKGQLLGKELLQQLLQQLKQD